MSVSATAMRSHDGCAIATLSNANLGMLSHYWGSKRALFDGDEARLLLDGGFRPEVDAVAVAALLPRARARFLEWMAAR